MLTSEVQVSPPDQVVNFGDACLDAFYVACNDQMSTTFICGGSPMHSFELGQPRKSAPEWAERAAAAAAQYFVGQQDDLSCRIATQGRGIKINLASGGGFRWLQTLRMWNVPHEDLSDTASMMLMCSCWFVCLFVSALAFCSSEAKIHSNTRRRKVYSCCKPQMWNLIQETESVISG